LNHPTKNTSQAQPNIILNSGFFTAII